MKFAVLLLASGLALSSATPGLAANDERFSTTLAASELGDTGLARLTSDQVAVLDALVRRDLAAAEYPSKQPRAVHFSERLSADERRNSGLASLTGSQLAQLDAAVQRLVPAPATAVFSSSAPVPVRPVPSAKLRREPEIHGMVSLMFGAGSDGYSERGGAMMLTYDDPSSGLGIAVGYSEIHTKGGHRYFGRDCFDDFGYYGRPGDLLR